MSVKSRAFLSRTLGEKSRLLVTWTLLSVVCCPAAAQTLRNVQVLFRHSDRTPLNGYPTAPFGPEDWPNGYAQLTQRGMRQSRDLGKFIRARYDGFLNSTYIADEVFARSTDKARTLTSAQSLLAGLYPPQGFQVWDPQINWQPIPVHTQTYDNDIELVTAPCLLHDEMYAEVLQSSDEAVKFFDDNKEMIEYVQVNAGWETRTFQNLINTYDPVSVMADHPELGFVLPDWVTPEVLAWLRYMAPYYDFFQGYTQDMRVLQSGSFIRMLTERMQNVASGETSPPTKLSLYAVHDLMQVSFLMAAGVWDGLEPPYASAIFFELHEPSPDKFTVKIFYKNNTVVDPEGDPMLLTIVGCEAECPLETFLQLMEPNMYKGTAEQWRRECNMDTRASSNGALIAVCVLAVAFVLVVLILVFVIKSRSSRPRYNSL